MKNNYHPKASDYKDPDVWDPPTPQIKKNP